MLTTLAGAVGRTVRIVGIGALCGTAAGMIAGLGARLDMWLAGRMAGADALDTPVHPVVDGGREFGGQVVGDVTLEGTLSIVIGTGLLGIIGGLLYVADRPWLARLGRWRGAAFGVLLLSAVGGLLFGAKPDSESFRRFGVPIVNVALFAALLPLFGALVAPLADGLHRVLPRRPRSLRAAAAYLPIALAAALSAPLVVFGFLELAATVAAAAWPPRLGQAALGSVLLMAALAARALSRRGPAGRAAGYALVAGPALVGLPFTLQAIFELLR